VIKARYLIAARKKVLRNGQKILVAKCGQGYLRDLSADSRITLKTILKKQGVVKNITFKWLRLMSKVGFV
jgi:hypothetical protein